MIRIPALLLLGLVAVPAWAREECLEFAAVARLLDGDVAADARVENLARAQECAAQGEALSAYVLGSLYRQPGRLPGVLDADPGRALQLLIQAAGGGERLAFAKVAETYLALGDNFEAMAWAQAYAHLEKAEDGQASGYAANLVQRIQAALGDAVGTAVDERAKAIIARDGVAYAQARAAASKAPDPDELVPDTRRRSREVESNPRIRVPDSGFVEFVLDVGPDGHVINVRVLDATPASNLSRDLRQVAFAMTFNARPGKKHRYALLPVVFDDQRLRLR